MEGPFWREIRGLGLSYHYDIWCNREKELLCFSLERSPNISEAYRVSKDIVREYETTPFDEAMLEGARSSVIFSLVSQEETIDLACDSAFLTSLSGTTVKDLMN